MTAYALSSVPVTAPGMRFSITAADGSEAARARLYILTNDLHPQPEGYLVDVFVEPAHRGSGLARRLVGEVIAAARAAGCYKLVATSRHSRPHVHALYLSLGFAEHGKEFRIEL